LQNSPWGRTGKVDNESSSGKAPSVSGDARLGNTGMSGQGTGELDYYVSLYSAPPVQLTMLRLQQIDQKYDKKSEAEKQAFDQQTQAAFAKFKDGEIALRVQYYSSKLNLEQDVGQFWQSLIPQGSVPDDTFLLTDDGRKIPPATYRSVKLGEFYVTFPQSRLRSEFLQD
jgi:hypothetical protein